MTDFGTDLSCVTDFSPHMQVTSGFRLVAEAIARRLQTPRGGLIDDSSYGYDLTGELNNDISTADLGRIASGVANECQKDPRILRAVATVTLTPSGTLGVSIALSTQQGPFKLVLSISQVSVSILSVGQ